MAIACRARYGVQLERGPFDKRTADFLWMMIFGVLTLLVSGCLSILLLTIWHGSQPFVDCEY